MAGHVTKEGDVAGPRVLEHMVDAVLSLEGEPLSALRVLRSTKNRFGSTNEVAIFQMEQGGLKEVADPSLALMSRRQGSQVGSAVVPTLEGSRPLLVEVQALTVPTHSPVPRRVVSGLDATRLVMLAAVLDRRAGLPLGGQDIIVNVAGGLRLSEPAADLGIALAVASSFRGAALPEDVAVVGEVGLGGEVRSVSQVGRRVQEAARLGLRVALVPAAAQEELTGDTAVKLVFVRSVADAIRQILHKERQGQGRDGSLVTLVQRDSEVARLLRRALEMEDAAVGQNLYLGWGPSEVQAEPPLLKKLVAKGILRISHRSDAATLYRLAEPEQAGQALALIHNPMLE
jgi:DNA repair protein RadA/Sms